MALNFRILVKNLHRGFDPMHHVLQDFLFKYSNITNVTGWCIENFKLSNVFELILIDFG